MVGESEAITPPGPSRSSEAPHGRFSGLLELVGLWSLAVAQPLLDLVGRGAPLLLHHRVDGLDLALWTTLVVLGVPLALWVSIAVLGRFASSAAAERAQALILGTLCVLVGLGVLRRLGDPVPAWLLLPLAVSGVWLMSDLAVRYRRLRQLFAWLSLSVPLVVGLFWISPAAVAARRTADRDPGTVFLDADVLEATGEALDGAGPGIEDATERRPSGPPPPVVLVIFDELPLLSILDADLRVDEVLCPELARLSRDATWYRNARTVSPWTNTSIASILIGRQADPDLPPTRTSYPSNLLTWLSSTHEVRAFELLTAMAPPGAVEIEPAAPRPTRLRRLTLDSAVVAAHQKLPPAYAGWLPSIDYQWGDFGSARVVRGGGGEAEPGERSAWAFALADVRAKEFDSFLETIEAPEGTAPSLYFAHVMLPHMPYRYLPSGAVYGGRPVYDSPSTAWSENDWFALETYQRHLLQVGFVDRLVGRLRSRLEREGLWDRSLVIVTADHGASHWPGAERRDPVRSEHPEDMLQVPLFVKTPRQIEGGVDDRPARSVDIAPTVAQVLGLSLPWPAEGRSLLVPAAGGDGFAPDRASLRRKLTLFDPANGPMRWVRFGPYRDVIGAEIGELAGRLPAGLENESRCTAEVDQLPVLERFDSASRYSPALLTGAVECADPAPEDAFLLAAINGRIAGSAPLQPAGSGAGLFAVMTEPSLLRPGANRLELILASGARSGSARSLRRIPID